jgi:hypothetical protein
MTHTMNTDYIKDDSSRTLFMLESVVETIGNILSVLEMQQTIIDELEKRIDD